MDAANILSATANARQRVLLAEIFGTNHAVSAIARTPQGLSTHRVTIADIRPALEQVDFLQSESFTRILEIGRGLGFAGFGANVPGWAKLTRRESRQCIANDFVFDGYSYFIAVSELDLSDTQVGNAEVVALASAPALTTLDLSGTQVGTAGVAALARVPTLTTLTLWNVQIGDAGAIALASAPVLTTLNLSNAPEEDGGVGDTPVGDAGVIALASAPALTTLYLSHMLLTDTGVVALANAPELMTLTLHGIPVTDEGVAALVNAATPVLTTLTLMFTGVTQQTILDLRRQYPRLRIEYLP